MDKVKSKWNLIFRDEILRLLGLVGSYGDMIELDEKWAYNIIKQVGNYKEIFNTYYYDFEDDGIFQNIIGNDYNNYGKRPVRVESVFY